MHVFTDCWPYHVDEGGFFLIAQPRDNSKANFMKFVKQNYVHLLLFVHFIIVPDNFVSLVEALDY